LINLRTREGWDDLKRELDARPDDVLRLCGIDVKRLSSGWTLIDDPLGHGASNFGICMRGGFLTWKNFTSGEGGRSLELIAYCRGWSTAANRGAGQAAELALAHFRLGTISEQDLARGRAAADAIRRDREQQSEAERDRKAKAAFATWCNAVPVLGTLGEEYLFSGRGIDLREQPFIGPRGGALAPHCLRFVQALQHYDDNRRRTLWPALIACCVDADMRIRAIHQTFLNHAGTDKAPVVPARKVWPDFGGCVIPLWAGDGNHPVAKANELFREHGVMQTIVLTEGVEDGLSAVLANPAHRVWACISLSNIANVAARLPECCDSVIVHRQNDWDKPAAVAAFEGALVALERTGRAVAIVEAYDGKDLNDTLRAG
jgi:hypothetical protein